ncbi:MAG: hypothetical protein SVV67_05255 [Bacillota bacterium]|nr:hypothetical protein [Bacillota bacterium]
MTGKTGNIRKWKAEKEEKAQHKIGQKIINEAGKKESYGTKAPQQTAEQHRKGGAGDVQQ